MQTNLFDTYPQTGWGQVVSLFTKSDVRVVNLAKNGTSAKSFRNGNYFAQAEKELSEGDLLIIGFAHNDEKKQDPSRYSEPLVEFPQELKYYVDFARNRKANVIVCTPVVRRKYVDGILTDTHGLYVDSIRNFAQNNNIPLVDLNALTDQFFRNLSELKSRRYYMIFEPGEYDTYPKGNLDNSHLRYDGAVLVAKVFVESVFRQNLKEQDYFNSLPEKIYCATSTYEK